MLARPPQAQAQARQAVGAHDVVAVDEHQALVPAVCHRQVRVREAAQLVSQAGVHVQRAPGTSRSTRQASLPSAPSVDRQARVHQPCTW